MDCSCSLRANLRESFITCASPLVRTEIWHYLRKNMINKACFWLRKPERKRPDQMTILKPTLRKRSKLEYWIQLAQEGSHSRPLKTRVHWPVDRSSAGLCPWNKSCLVGLLRLVIYRNFSHVKCVWYNEIITDFYSEDERMASSK